MYCKYCWERIAVLKADFVQIGDVRNAMLLGASIEDLGEDEDLTRKKEIKVTLSLHNGRKVAELGIPIKYCPFCGEKFTEGSKK